MSETSFDTSAADTLTSGLSLGQCIKHAAEESQPPDDWYELKPTQEKEWHTLRGEPTSQVTLTEEDFSELPATDYSACSSKQDKSNDKEHSNPMSRLFHHADKSTQPFQQDRLQRYLSDTTVSKNTFPTTSDLCTPAVATHQHKVANEQATLDVLSGYQYVTPNITGRGKSGKEHFTRLVPSTAWPEREKSSKEKFGDDDVLSSQNISNLLEKDDSLAQRVRDLLEDEKSSQADTTLLIKGSVPVLLQTPKQKDDIVDTARSAPRSESELEERIILSDASLCSASDKTIETKVPNSSNVLLTTLNLINESGLEVGRFYDQSSGLGETFESLNASKGTEYGELPATVDIPHGIMDRLNNMRLIGQRQNAETVNKSQAWAEPTSTQGTPREARDAAPTAVAELQKIDHYLASQPSDKVPIAGDAKFYTGSNPTTPQFPIEEEKLQQLQSYIEKKTGLPTISPLVADGMYVASSNVQATSNQAAVTPPAMPTSAGVPFVGDTQNSSKTEFVKDTPPKCDVGLPTVQTDTSTNNKKQPVKHQHVSVLPPATSLQITEPGLHDGSSQPSKTPLHSDTSKRSEPEGMSPPIVSSAGPSLSSNTGRNISASSGTKQVKPSPDSQQESHLNDDKEEAFENVDLADESLLARIKSALSDSFSQKPISSSCQVQSTGALDRSDMSFASSIDSLAVHVKALLEEEVPQLIHADDPQNASNLTDVIENFEHTDLWKFVAQFLPSAENLSMQQAQPDANVTLRSSHRSELTNKDESIADSTFDNSILERIREELRKSTSQYSAQHHSTPANPSKAVSTLQPLKQTPLPIASAPADVNSQPAPSLAKQHSGETTSVSNSVKPSLVTLQEEASNATLQEDISFDPIPGIPDFNRSVVHSSHSSSTSTTPRTSTDTVQEPAAAKLFSDYKTTAASVITSQMNRAAQRNFDVSLTPGCHLSFFSQKTPNKGVDVHSLSPTDDIQSQNDKRAERSRNSGSKSSYFKSNSASGSWNKSQNLSLQSFNQSTDSHKHSIKASSIKDVKPASQEQISRKETQVKPVTSKNVPSSMHTRTPLVTQTDMSNIAPQLTAGIPSRSSSSKPSAHTSRYSAGSGYSTAQSHPPASRKENRSEVSFSTPVKSLSRSKSPMRDRMTVHDWLKSPERNSSLGRQKRLPTFEELMEEESKEEQENIEAHEISEYPLDLVPTSDKKSGQREKFLNTPKTTAYRLTKQTHESSATSFQIPEKLEGKKTKNITGSEWEKSSLRPQIDMNDSYQQALTTAHAPSVTYDSSMRIGNESDIDMQRRMINQTSSSQEELPSRTSYRIPRTLNEFQSLDEKSQHEAIKDILEWYSRKKRQSKSLEKRTKVAATKDVSSRRAAAAKKPASGREMSLDSNQAVCDSDSTEYCDLPSTRPATAQTNESGSQRILSMDESKAEQVMKRLLDKIKQQKIAEKAEKRKHKKNPAKSSTPQRTRPPMVVPEASSIASTTDTDVGGRYYLKVRDRRHGGHKKVAYVEEVSSSEPTVIKVKRKHKKPEVVHSTERIVLHDRSIQTASPDELLRSQDVSTNFPSPIHQAGQKKQTKGVQTAFTPFRRSNKEKKADCLDDTITLQTNQEDKENIDTNIRKSKRQQHRFSSFYVDVSKPVKKSNQKDAETQHAYKSVAWYEPYQYEPLWMQKPRRQSEKGLIPLTLQEALTVQNPDFISKSRERQRKITINSDERRMQEVWAEERQRVFGAENATKQRRRSEPPPRRNIQLTRKQIVAETKEKYQQLPEVVRRKREEERKREYASNRLKAQLYKKRIQSKVLGRYFIN